MFTIPLSKSQQLNCMAHRWLYVKLEPRPENVAGQIILDSIVNCLYCVCKIIKIHSFITSYLNRLSKLLQQFHPFVIQHVFLVLDIIRRTASGTGRIVFPHPTQLQPAKGLPFLGFPHLP